MGDIPKREFKSIEVIDPASGRQRNCFLVKYEKRQYGSMRIGTLEYFRTMEANQGDHLEGRVEGLVFSPSQTTPVTTAELHAISAGQLTILARDGMTFGPGARYQDETHRRCNNVYVYCCSMEFGVFPDRERMNHFGASEYFIIDDTEELRNFVASALQRKARTASGDPFDPAKHYLMSWGAPVRYRPRKNAEFELPVNNLDFFVYQKDPKFQVEQEYRFVWAFFDKETNLPIDIDHNPIDIPISTSVGTAHVKFD